MRRMNSESISKVLKNFDYNENLQYAFGYPTSEVAAKFVEILKLY
jgi:hypothetical protein